MYRSEDWVIGALVSLVIGVLVFLPVFSIGEAVKADNYNNKFAVKCVSEGGVPVIGDKDMCLKDGKVLFYEH